MSLYFRNCAVATLSFGSDGRPTALTYDPRWLATEGAFAVSRALPLQSHAHDGPRLAQWDRHVSIDGVAPFEERLDIGPARALFGAFNLRRTAPISLDCAAETPGAAERVVTPRQAGEGGFERIIFLRHLAQKCGLHTTPWRFCEETSALRIRRADRVEHGGGVSRLPLELVGFGGAALRSASLFRRLDGVLDAPSRLSLLDRLIFSSLAGVAAPSLALRLDKPSRIAPIGADWIGRPQRGATPTPEDWRRFGERAGLNKTLTPRRAQRLAKMLHDASADAARETAHTVLDLNHARIEEARRALMDRVAAVA